jgi:hypothetical protein
MWFFTLIVKVTSIIAAVALLEVLPGAGCGFV